MKKIYLRKELNADTNFQNAKLMTNNFFQVTEVCLQILLQIFIATYVAPIRGDMNDKEIEMSSKHEKVYMTCYFENEFEAIF